MDKKMIIIEILREVFRTKKEPAANGDVEREKIIEELKEKHCIYECTIKHVGACMSDPNEKFVPHEEMGYNIDKNMVFKLYGIEFPC